MAELRHRMIRTHGDDAESHFVCTVLDCHRHVVLNHLAGSLMVLTPGLGAVHYGFSGPTTADNGHAVSLSGSGGMPGLPS